ncbi:MAG: MFS transporter [Chloroflexota bacterium]
MTPSGEARLSGSLPVQVAAFVAARTVINTMQRMVYPFLPVFGRGLGVDLAQLSLALSLRSATGVLGPILASIGDSRGRKTGLLTGMGLLTLGAAVISLSPTYPAFVAMLVLSITANLVFIPSVQAFVGDRIPYQRRGLVVALTEFAWSLSFIFGVPAVGFLIERGGWQAPFPWLTLLGLLMIGGLWWIVPGDQPAPGARHGLWRSLGLIAHSPAARAGVVVGVCMSGANELVNLIFGVWLEDAFAVKIATLAIASLIIGLSEMSGELLVTGFVDRLGKRRAAGLGFLLNGAAALALPALGVELNTSLVGLFLFYITFEFTVVSSLALMTEVLPEARATFIAAYIASTALGRALGSLAAPSLYRFGQGLDGLPAILPTVSAALLIDLLALALLWRIPDGQPPAALQAAQSPV